MPGRARRRFRLCANLATPLYAGFSDRFGFSTVVLSLIFAVYALVLMPRSCCSARCPIVSGGGRSSPQAWRCRSGRWACSRVTASCIVQVLVRRGAPPAQAQAGGLVLLALGLLGLVLAHWLAPVLLIIGAALAGAGHGLAFLAAQDNLIDIAPAEQRAEISAAFYVCIYLGVAVPVIGIGILGSVFSLFVGIGVFAAVTGAASLATAAWHLRHRRERR